ncbi:MAG: M6 family metalloprotease domain-containing protein [Mesorhizobium sp.]|nr:MAG: M6 family metalloprotease domain-containing protein [Mesorhizobium sp.]
MSEVATRATVQTVALACLVTLIVEGASAKPPAESAAPETTQALEDVRTKAIDSYVVRRGLKSRTEAARAVRRYIENLPPGIALAAPVVRESAVTGSADVPILLVKFTDISGDPYPPGALQTQLFDGPWPSGTMSDDYREMSRGAFSVGGQVFDWLSLPNSNSFYSGPPGCNGICNNSKMGDLLTTALDGRDAEIDFSSYDNDGPDSVPNSGDDDGFVDFVAFVHANSGGECPGLNDKIWSHRFSLNSLTGSNYQTQDAGKLGSNILIDDYVVMPALACDGSTMIQIGVFSHEFGHAFGLPDLYDSQRPNESEGVGAWGLMGSGSWGGDGHSTPQTPTHMETWSKEFLGWISPRVIDTDQTGVVIRPVSTGDAVRVDYADTADPEDKKYLLLEFRKTEGFDSSLKASGLLVTEVNNSRVEAGLVNNSVNGSPLDMGVNIIEADGQRHLDGKGNNRADEGDVFPGSMNIASADASHAEKISAALCNIVQTTTEITLDIFVSQTTCPGALAPVAVAPAEALSNSDIGQEVIVEGVLSNRGTNYFTDRDLVVTGAGGEISVVSPAPLKSAQPDSFGSADGREDLSDLLDKKILLRGHLERQIQKGKGLTNVLVIEEYQLVE